MQEHDGKQLAGFGKDVSDVVDMTQTSVAKGRGERLGDGDEQQAERYGEVGKDAGGGGGGRV